MSQEIVLRLGDSIELMRGMPEGSIGSVCTDPPYMLNFMNRKWDRCEWAEADEAEEGESVDEDEAAIPVSAARAQQAWHLAWLREAFRVLRPGGVVKAFGGTRTFHRLAAAMEEAGFVDVGTSLEAWCYGSGFPKSLNIQKNLEKQGHIELAKKFEGYGTALKPAFEVFIVGRKP